jgi:hypothetical protein
MKILQYVLLTGCCALVFACAPLSAHADEPSLTNRQTELRQSPDDSASIIRTLAEKTSTQVLERRGAWSRVKVERSNEMGWVRMMHLRGGATVVEAESSGGFFASFNRLLSGDSRKSTRGQSATVGIRGFSREDVERAQLNPAEFEKLKRYQANQGDADRFATQGRLAFRSVAYLAQDAIDASATNGRGDKK